MKCNDLSRFKKDCPNIIRESVCIADVRKVIIPASMGTDEEGQPYAPENGAYNNAVVFYEANEAVYFYSTDGIPTRLAYARDKSGVLTVNGRAGDVVITLAELGGLNNAQVQALIDGKLEDYATAEELEEVTEKIPEQATAENQLADKAFVNSSLNSITAFYITKNAQGEQFATYAELAAATQFYSGGEPRVPTRNDYCIVLADETKTDPVTGEKPTTRYIYQTDGWEFQYIVNKTTLTAAQLAAVNSNITAAGVTKLTGLANIQTIGNNLTLTNGRLDASGGSSINVVQTTGQSTTDVMSQKAVTDALADAGGVKVLTSADYNYHSGAATTDDGVALWSLSAGVYVVGEKYLKLYKESSGNNLNYASYIVISDNDYKETNLRGVYIFYAVPLNNQSGFPDLLGEYYEVYKNGNGGGLTLKTIYGPVNNLTTTNAGASLSAAQGKVLKDLIDATAASVPVFTYTTTDPGPGGTLEANHFVVVYED